jgi:hypothetical protein
VNRVRELVKGLRLAQLNELGLGAAIREQAECLGAVGSALELRVYGQAEPGLPAVRSNVSSILTKLNVADWNRSGAAGREAGVRDGPGD